VLDEWGGASHLVDHLARRRIAMVLVAAPETLADYTGVASVVACLLPPVEATELARTLEIAALGSDVPVLASGSFYFDARTCLVSVDGADVHLPPKELAVMAELARHPGQPVASPQLVSHIYSESPATPEDIHRLVYRLAQLIGDHERVPPLVMNR